jgi:AraC family transcriptional regulator
MKRDTNNEYQKMLNLAVDYINEHIHENLELSVLAGISSISEFHFHRIFRALIGESPGSFIARLRLEKAASLLQTSRFTLTEIAEQTGYQNQHALSKSFKRHFGVNPSAFRNVHNFFSSHIRQDFSDHAELTPEIRYESDKQLLYIRIIDQYGAEDSYSSAWARLISYVSAKGLFNGSNEFIGLSFDDPNITNHLNCRYYACLTVSEPVKPEGEVGTYYLKDGKYAVFSLKGSYSGLAELYNAIYRQWLPNTNLQLSNAMSFEKYFNCSEQVPEEQLLTEIYIPVQ